MVLRVPLQRELLAASSFGLTLGSNSFCICFRASKKPTAGLVVFSGRALVLKKQEPGLPERRGSYDLQVFTLSTFFVVQLEREESTSDPCRAHGKRGELSLPSSRGDPRI